MKGYTKHLHMITFMLLAIGGLNSSIFVLSGWGIGSFLGGSADIAMKILYTLVGLSAIYELATHKQNCSKCVTKNKSIPTPPVPPAGGMQS